LPSFTRKLLDLELEISILIFAAFLNRYLKQSGWLCLATARVLLRYWILQRFVWNPEFPYRADNSPLPAPVLSHLSPLDAPLLSHFFKIPFSIVLPSTSRSSDCYLSFRGSPQTLYPYISKLQPTRRSISFLAFSIFAIYLYGHVVRC